MPDEVRLLGKRGGYTDDPAKAMDRAEPEAVSREDQRRITAAAARDWPHLNVLHTAVREADTLDNRLRRARAEAKSQRLDVHRELRLVRLAIEGGRSRGHVEQRIAALENRVWPGTLPTE
jgi:hypothetical protein